MDASKTFANEMRLWGVIDRGVNGKVVTIDDCFIALSNNPQGYLFVCSLKNLSTLKRPRGSTLPGLIISLTYRDINDGNVDKELIKEEYESIIALLGPLSFINHLQNNYGPIDDGFNITTVPHYQFDCFVACVYLFL